jgi:hypothetical protein
VADTGWLLASGEGEQLIDSGVAHLVVSMNAYIETVNTPRVRIIGTNSPKRVQYGGSCGLGGTVVNNNGDSIVVYGDPIPLQFEALYWFLPALTFTQAYADRVWWKLPLGIEWRLKFYW